MSLSARVPVTGGDVPHLFLDDFRWQTRVMMNSVA